MKEVENILTIIAAISASFFFIWQIVAGWLVVNVKIEIITERQAINDEQDLLAFKIILEKGKTDTLQVKDIQARIRTQNENTVLAIFVFDEIHKLDAPANIIDWKEFNKDGRNISLSPEESFHLGRYLKVSADLPLIVEAALHGTRTFWGRGFQWRASTVSLPIKREVDRK